MEIIPELQSSFYNEAICLAKNLNIWQGMTLLDKFKKFLAHFIRIIHKCISKLFWIFYCKICLILPNSVICQLSISANFVYSIVRFIWILSGRNSSCSYEQSNLHKPHDYCFTLWNRLISYVLLWFFFVVSTTSVPRCTRHFILHTYGVVVLTVHPVQVPRWDAPRWLPQSINLLKLPPRSQIIPSQPING